MNAAVMYARPAQFGVGAFGLLLAVYFGALTLYSTLGQGRIHYFYQQSSAVVWLAVDPPVARQTLAALMKSPRAVRQ